MSESEWSVFICSNERKDSELFGNKKNKTNFLTFDNRFDENVLFE
jgi:hypothetical protein